MSKKEQNRNIFSLFPKSNFPPYFFQLIVDLVVAVVSFFKMKNIKLLLTILNKQYASFYTPFFIGFFYIFYILFYLFSAGQETQCSYLKKTKKNMMIITIMLFMTMMTMATVIVIYQVFFFNNNKKTTTKTRVLLLINT